VRARPAPGTPAMVAGLPPRVHPLVRSFLDRADLPADLLSRWGSPLNVVFPEIFRDNVGAFRRVLDTAGLQYRIHYAHKANQAGAFVGAALEEGIGIDVASPGELVNALHAGFPADRVEVTGPKGRGFLDHLVGSGVTVNVDNVWELSEIIRLARARGARVPVLVRVCGFGSGASGPGRVSRFGVPLARYESVTGLLCAAPDTVDFLGLSFHLDSSEVRDKVQAVDDCLQLFERSWTGGLTPRVLNIGGGFRQAFAGDPDAYEEYVQALRRGLAGQGSPLTWDGNMLGYRYEAGAIRGIPVFHKYAGTVTGSEHLRELLDSPLSGHGGRLAGRVLRENMIETWVEPGKALVDHAGLTLASVEFVKEASDGSVLVNLDISRDKICPADQEVMLDPILIYRSADGERVDGESADGEPAGGQHRHKAGVFFAGNLCLERDMIFNHLTFVDRLPEPGDIVVFVNTAGYQMDLSASAALMQRQPGKAVVVSEGGGFAAHADSVNPREEAP
jgi:diaminopimelate decarboxylase